MQALRFQASLVEAALASGRAGSAEKKLSFKPPAVLVFVGV